MWLEVVRSWSCYSAAYFLELSTRSAAAHFKSDALAANGRPGMVSAHAPSLLTAHALGVVVNSRSGHRPSRRVRSWLRAQTMPMLAHRTNILRALPSVTERWPNRLPQNTSTAVGAAFGERWSEAQLNICYRTPQEVMALTGPVLRNAGSHNEPPSAVR